MVFKAVNFVYVLPSDTFVFQHFCIVFNLINFFASVFKGVEFDKFDLSASRNGTGGTVSYLLQDL
jgi:hypothetical protein